MILKSTIFKHIIIESKFKIIIIIFLKKLLKLEITRNDEVKTKRKVVKEISRDENCIKALEFVFLY